ncbi:DUF5677 domain-containing protein [Brevibacillus sp. H7]|uniref:DUF5677 domain-containing protein n=1 Tax=Brevibacillus sp. H7 TaxID=3349138 RepID=UPI00380C3C84
MIIIRGNVFFLTRSEESLLNQLGTFISGADQLLKDCTYELPGPIDEVTMTVILLYRKLLERIDAVFSNIEHATENAALSITRDAFENYLYLLYIHECDTKNRALAYYIQTRLIEQKTLLNKFHSRYKNSSMIKDTLQAKYTHQEIDDFCKKLDNRLQSPGLLHLTKERKRVENLLRKKGLPPYANWYSLYNGPRNIKELAVRLKKQVEYDIIYHILSIVTHSLNAFNALRIQNDLAFIQELRTYNNPNFPLGMSLAMLVQATQTFIESLFPHKITEFQKIALSVLEDDTFVMLYQKVMNDDSLV